MWDSWKTMWWEQAKKKTQPVWKLSYSHRACLNSQRVPVHFIVWKLRSSLKGPCCLQSFLRWGSISPSSSPVQNHTAARVTSQDQIHRSNLIDTNSNSYWWAFWPPIVEIDFSNIHRHNKYMYHQKASDKKLGDWGPLHPRISFNETAGRQYPCSGASGVIGCNFLPSHSTITTTQLFKYCTYILKKKS